MITNGINTVIMNIIDTMTRVKKIIMIIKDIGNSKDIDISHIANSGTGNNNTH